MSDSLLTIGQLARRAGLRPSAVRYYEQLGLLHPACRVGGKRRFGADAVDRLTVIRFAKSLGFALEEVKTLVAVTEGGSQASRTLRKLAADKIPEIDRELERLTRMRKMLTAAQACSCPSTLACAKAAG